MSHLAAMLELEEALQRILATIPAAVIETIPLRDADGRILGETITSAIDLPPFDNSAMDGYAVRSADLAGAGAQSPKRLSLIGKVVAGETFAGQLGPGNCVRIFTGSPLPPGADAVVMQEDTRADGTGAVQFLSAAVPGENVRRHGEDVSRGQTLLKTGERLGPCQLGLLAATGFSEIKVGRPPVIGLLSTGSEIVAAGQGSLRPGQIYESNSVGIAALARRAGCSARILKPVTDDLPATRSALEEGFRHCDALVTSGGVSVGELDFVKQAFAEIGGELQFWKVAIKPGRPFVFGRRRDRFLFGLPGNPVSALVTFLVLVRPALLRWQGASEVTLPLQLGHLAEPLSNPGERRHFMRVHVDASAMVRLAGGQGSHMLGSFSTANALVDVPPGSSWPAGKQVEVMRW